MKDERTKKAVQEQEQTTTSSDSTTTFSGGKKPVDLENLEPGFKAIIAKVAEKNKGVLAAKTPCMEAWTETSLHFSIQTGFLTYV